MARKKQPPFSYEQALSELQQIVERLEQGSTSMDELTEQLERAEALIRQCRAHLRKVEAQVHTFGRNAEDAAK